IRKTRATGGLYRVRPANWSPPADPCGLKLNWPELPDPELVKLLGDARPVVRERAQARLVARGAAAIPPLAKGLNEPASVSVQQQVIGALARIEQPAALPPLRQVLEGNTEDTLIPAARALGLRRDKAAAAALQRLLKHKSPHVRHAAADALARCGNADSP